MSRAIGTVTTASATEAAIEATTYTEPTTPATTSRALVSSSANDTAAGTGARQVRVTYYALDSSGNITGPFVEVVTLNGATAVPTISQTMTLIEKMEIVAVGSGGVAAGIIKMTVDAAGAGATIGSIAAGARQTLWAHHYVASKRQCRVSDFVVTGGDTTLSQFSLRALAYPTPPGGELELTGIVGATNAQPSPREVAYSQPPLIIGPARVRAYVTPAIGTSTTNSASFGFTDTWTGFGS